MMSFTCKKLSRNTVSFESETLLLSKIYLVYFLCYGFTWTCLKICVF